VLQVHHVNLVVLVVAMMMSQWCLLSEALLNPVEAAALFDLCDRPGNDLWANCSDSANACINTANWTGITCDSSNTSIINMYVSLIGSPHAPPQYTHHQLTVHQISMLSRRCGRINSGVDWKPDTGAAAVRSS